MDLMFVALIIVTIASLIGGIFSLLKYFKTKNKLFLVLGIILTFVVPAVLLLIIVTGVTTPMVTYAPMPPEPNVPYGPSPRGF